MNARALRSSLFICFIVGFSRAQILSEILHGIEDAASTFTESVANVTLRDDDGNPVLLDLNLGYPETLSETERDLPNRVFFYLYTRDNKNDSQQLYPNDTTSLKSSNFDPTKETIFLIHGWMSSAQGPMVKTVREAFMEHGDYNIIAVDWSKIASKPYIWCSDRVVMVGRYVASMTDFLQVKGMNMSRITNVGHSLGAHIAGLSSYYATTLAHYVVGLDPALPHFETAKEGSSLTRNDAKYVMIIHTSLIGYKNANGYSDFYPNGGTWQPGCLADIACSHLRSFYYFAESINTKKGFWSKKCSYELEFRLGLCNSNANALMGGAEPDFSVEGIYYLKTASEAPYALGRQ
ncbi:pancreatic lipase-related protein 2-like [Hylaeus volcanicus]|uniref:pancreatic lipase-related protein 2-like n=1 Tax=Hylaeus volcanicus TaxID=313075 RepID=UPI0023B79D33|nr:pancreatic lipase-related protein 2-like [Hylaeus volcanicus]